MINMEVSNDCENRCAMSESKGTNLPNSISVKTLNNMDKAIENYKLGIVSEPIDLD